eukprot:10318143-Alexandrium_andersonii.AAC.1
MPSSACALDAAAFSRTPSVPWPASPALRRRRLGPCSPTASRSQARPATTQPSLRLSRLAPGK